MKAKAESKTYLNNPALVALKVLQEAEQYSAKKAKFEEQSQKKAQPN